MSFDFNYKLWLSTKRDLNQLIKKQDLLKQKPPIGDAHTSFKILSQMYILYSELVDKLAHLYRETFQVQKKEVIRNLAEPAIRRLMEIKNKLKEFELSVYVYLDEVLVERKMTPYDLMIWNSSFLYTRPKDIRNLFKEATRFRKISSEEIVQAITKIQSHERARKARLLDKTKISSNKFSANKITYFFTHKENFPFLVPIKRTLFSSDFMKTSGACETPLDTENFGKIQSVDETDITEHQTKSALIIQRAWKTYKARKLLKQQLDFKRSLYGLVKTKKIRCQTEYEQNIIRINKKYEKQEELYEKYQQLMQDERERLLEEKKAQLMEDISDHIREWFKEFYEKTGDFHPYPDAAKSGTVLLLTDETMDLNEFKEFLKTQDLSKAERKNLAEKLKLKKQKLLEKNNKEKQKELKRQLKMLKTGAYDISHELKSDKNIQLIEHHFAQYSTDWKNVDEYLNKSQDAIKEWVTESQLAIIHKELRNIVDKQMRVEYNMLKKAWSIDTKKKFKPAKTKEAKKFKKKKKSKTIDLTADRTIESLYEELETAGIIGNYPVKEFGEFLGDFNILADNLRNQNNLVTLNAAKADVRFAVQDILFGMGAFNVEKPKTLCLIGPVNTGKGLLCNIIASELGALFINLSPEKTVQFRDNINYFIHIVMKVAKAFQPSIIFIKDAHRVFWKKIPKDQTEMKPTLLKMTLSKNILRSIGKYDKIMVLGTSSLPWTADKMFVKVFQNFLLIPESDYGTVYLMWLQLLTQNLNRDDFEDFALSVLAKIFQKYNSGDIADNVTGTLNVKRRLQLHLNPIKPDEFLDYFYSQSDPLLPPEEKVLAKYRQWYKNTSKYEKLRLVKEAGKIKKK